MRVYPLGMAMVHAALVDAGHEVLSIDTIGLGAGLGSLGRLIEDFDPDLVGVSVRNIDDQNMADPHFFLDEPLELIKEVGDSTAAPILLGGPGYSIFPMACLEYLGADYGIQGEGEESVRMLIRALPHPERVKDIPGLYSRESGLHTEREFIGDPDRYPLPGPQAIYPPIDPDDEFWAPIQTRRGCPMKCSYCSTPAIEGCSHRRRDLDTVIRCLKEWVNQGFSNFFFVDNTFNLPKFYAKKLCEKIIAAGLDIRWRCIIYPTGFDEELAKLMAKAGCVDVSLGCESGDDQVLNLLNKRFRAQDARRVSDILKWAGIRRMGFLMLGCPGETKESVIRSLEFSDSLDLDSVKVTKGVRIYPDTQVAAVAVEKGMIKPDDTLLFPRFYMEEGLEGWLDETVKAFTASRPNWII